MIDLIIAFMPYAMTSVCSMAFASILIRCSQDNDADFVAFVIFSSLALLLLLVWGWLT